MNDSMEMMNNVAKQLAEGIKIAVQAQASAEPSGMKIAEIEAEMREVVRQIGIQALGMVLSSLQSTPEREIGCGCGGTLHDQRMRPATLISVFGRVTYERAYYAGCTWGAASGPGGSMAQAEPDGKLVTSPTAQRGHPTQAFVWLHRRGQNAD